MRDGGIAPRILNLGTRRWVASLTARPLYPRYPFDTGWVDPSTGLNAVAKSKTSGPCRESSLVRSARSLVTVPTELPRFLFNHLTFQKFLIRKGSWTQSVWQC